MPFLVNHSLFLHTVVWIGLKALYLIAPYTSKNLLTPPWFIFTRSLWKLVGLYQSFIWQMNTWSLIELNNFHKSLVFIEPFKNWNDRSHIHLCHNPNEEASRTGITMISMFQKRKLRHRKVKWKSKWVLVPDLALLFHMSMNSFTLHFSVLHNYLPLLINYCWKSFTMQMLENEDLAGIQR